MHDLLKKYIDIVNESMSYTSLNDAGPNYRPGATEIWYWKGALSHDFLMGYKAASKKYPNLGDNLSATHVKIGNVAENDPEKVFSMMQGEAWSPRGEARALIQKLGTQHTSMSTGDIVVIDGKVFMVDLHGFVNLATGDNI